MTWFRRVAPAGAGVVAAIGLTASVASLVDSMRPVAAFCAESGCAAVRASAWAHPLGVPLPGVGIAFFGLALILAATGPRWRRARSAMAAAGALGALALIAVQRFAIGSWCQLCLVADGAALVHGALVIAAASTWPRPRAARAAAFAGLAAAAVALPLLLRPSSPAAPPAGDALPEVIAREQVPGAVVVVDFIDFECPFCRRLHARLVDAIARAEAPVRIVRKMAPMDMHPGALPAAIAWCCADAQGKGDAMADALMAAPVAQLTPAGCEAIAARLGCDLARYRADAAAPWVRARIASDLADARAAGVQYLPTIYIGAERLVGAGASVEDLIAALHRAHGA